MRILCEQDVDRLIEPTAAVEAAAEGYRMHAERLMAEPGRLDLRRAQPKSGALILGGAESRGAGIEIDVANGSIPPPIDVQSITNRSSAVRVADGGIA
jgi:hypothetical protein